MGAVKLAAALALAALPGADTAQWRPEIAAASARCGVPEAWIERVMRAESGGRTMLAGRPIRSPKGAIGLMQLMPGTWAEMRAALGLGDDPDDARDNIIAGACYLRLMYDRFRYPGLFAAYNAGPARYAAYLAGRSRLPGETIDYLAKVGGAASSGDKLAGPRPVETLFVTLNASPAAPIGDAKPATDPLFAVKRTGE